MAWVPNDIALPPVGILTIMWVPGKFAGKALMGCGTSGTWFIEVYKDNIVPHNDEVPIAWWYGEVTDNIPDYQPK